MKSQRAFKKFINQYSLSKTLRFELKPVWETQRLLEENNVFRIDEIIRDKYIKTKPYFDRLHRKFVQESLGNFRFVNLSNYEIVLKNFLDDRKNKDFKKELEKIEKGLRKEVVQSFDKMAKIWATERFLGLKNKSIKFLDEEGVFENVLLPLYGKNKDGSYAKGTAEPLKKVNSKTGEILEEKEISIFEGWKGFTGYFKKFFETRKNFYKDDGTSTAIATRIVDNLQRCFENKWLLEKYDANFLKILNNGKVNFLQSSENFGQFVLQGKKNNEDNKNFGKGIDGYNQIVGEIKKEANLFKQKNKVKIQHLKTLDKQILSPKDKFIEEIEDEAGLKIELENLVEEGNKKVGVLKGLFSNFVKNNENFDLEKIYWTKKGFETISRKYAFQQEKEWNNALFEIFKQTGDKTVKYNKEKDKYKFPDFIPLAYIKKSLEILAENFTKEDIFWKEKYNQKNTAKENIWNQFLQIFQQEFLELFLVEKEREGKREMEGYEIFAKNLKEKLQEKKNK